MVVRNNIDDIARVDTVRSEGTPTKFSMIQMGNPKSERSVS